MSEEYNGYTNYETWLLCLNVDNDQGLYESINDLVNENSNINETYQLGDLIREYIEEIAWIDDIGIYKICDTWTQRDWQEIDWIEVTETRLEA